MQDKLKLLTTFEQKEPNNLNFDLKEMIKNNNLDVQNDNNEQTWINETNAIDEDNTLVTSMSKPS